MANCVDHYDLCVVAVPDPDDENTILIRETGDPNPDAVVRTPRENWLKFLAEVKAGEFDDV
jgi:hypothetical protein